MGERETQFSFLFISQRRISEINNNNNEEQQYRLERIRMTSWRGEAPQCLSWQIETCRESKNHSSLSTKYGLQQSELYDRWRTSSQTADVKVSRAGVGHGRMVMCQSETAEYISLSKFLFFLLKRSCPALLLLPSLHMHKEASASLHTSRLCERQFVCLNKTKGKKEKRRVENQIRKREKYTTTFGGYLSWDFISRE